MWARIATTLLGIWLMAAPEVLGFGKSSSDNAHIVGPLIATFSIISLSECTRNVQLFNLPFAVWLLLAPWILQYDNNTALLNDYAVGILVILLSFVKMKRQNRFGGGWPAIWRSNSVHSRKAGNPQRIRLDTGQE